MAERKRPTKKPARRKAKPKQLCTALKLDGDPCTRTRKKGLQVCASHARTAHRPTKFTDDVRKKVIEALQAGVSRTDAATHAGISGSTLDDYLGNGRKAREAGVDNEYAQFLGQVEATEVGLKILLIGRVVAGSKDDPKLGLELAARKWPGEYGRKDSKIVEHSGTVGVEHLLGGRHAFQVSPEARDRIVAILEEENPEPIEGTAEEVDP